MHSLEGNSRLTTYETYSAIQEKTGRVIDSLIPPDLPEAMEYLWLQYVEVRKGLVDVDYIGLDAYSRVTGYELTAWESELMLEIDLLRNRNG